MITQKITVDVNHTKNPEPIVCRLGESGTRIIRFELVEYVDGIAEAVEYSQENPTAQLRIVKPDNTFVIVNAVRAEPTERVLFDVVLPAEAAQVVGIGFYDFRIYDGADEEPAPDAFLYTEHGQVIIDDDILTDEMIESVASANGMVFPDDFLTSADLADYVTDEELEDYATKNYVEEAIAEIPDPLHNYSENEVKVGTWIDGSDLYERTYVFDNISASSTFDTLMDVTGFNIKNISGYASYSGVNADMYLNTLIDGNYKAIVYKDGNLLKYTTWYYGNPLLELVLILQYTKA